MTVALAILSALIIAMSMYGWRQTPRDDQLQKAWFSSSEFLGDLTLPQRGALSPLHRISKVTMRMPTLLPCVDVYGPRPIATG